MSAAPRRPSSSVDEGRNQSNFDQAAREKYLIDDIARFDAGIEVYAPTRRMQLAYDTPYVRNLPMRLEIQESTADANATTVLGPFYKDPFEAELEAFHLAVTAGGENRTSLSDSLCDFAIFDEIVACLKRRA